MTGIILAGGKSSRMGRNKALMEWQGQTLFERSLQVLRSVFSEVLISTNSPELYSAYPEKKIPDHFPDCGPLGGLQACLEAAGYDYSFFVACDMPFIDAEAIRFLAGLTDTVDIVVPQVAGGLHPLHAFYRKSCLPFISKNLEAKDLKIINFYFKCDVRVVEQADFREFPDIEQILRNINTPEDWAEIQAYREGCVPDRYRY